MHISGRFHKPDKPDDNIQQVRIEWTYVNGSCICIARLTGISSLDHHRANNGGRKLQPKRKIRAIQRGIDNCPD